MGQQSSSNVQEFVTNSLAKIVMCDDRTYSLFAEEINGINYEDFLSTLGELNKLSKSCLDSTGKQLLFAVKRGSDTTVFWKATVQIACVKIDPSSQKVHNYRLLNLREFLQVFKTLKNQHSIAEASKSETTVSTFYNNIDELTKIENNDMQTECCICFERRTDILLACAHSFCMQCIEDWNEDHHTCPVCREQINSTDDTWVLSEVPKAEEISAEIRTCLMDLAEGK